MDACTRILHTFARAEVYLVNHAVRFREALGHPTAWNRALHKGAGRYPAGAIRYWQDRNLLRRNPAPGTPANSYTVANVWCVTRRDV